ncbi:MAG: CaiB/BaiF CoA-transferase family protein [Beijerinckiaceae bacterium]
MTAQRRGPLTGLRIVEFAAIGPGPFAAMMLADMGADIVRIDRKASKDVGVPPAQLRGRRSIALDLKSDADVELARRLADRADALVEGFRPGVMERLGLGPDALLARNPKLVYGRMTGWGQEGPLADRAGHDINYIAITGALNAIGLRTDKPVIPLNLLGDFGGGSMFLITGLLAAIIESRGSGKGQVVDAAICDGVAALTTFFHALRADEIWSDERESNFIDGGSHFYNVYACADGKHISVGAIEKQFYVELRQRAGLADPAFDAQSDRKAWPDLRDKLAAIFATRTRDEWCALFEGSDACVAPVLDWRESVAHPHNRARDIFIERDGAIEPAPAPRFSRTPSAMAPPGPRPDQDRDAILADWEIATP